MKNLLSANLVSRDFISAFVVPCQNGWDRVKQAALRDRGYAWRSATLSLSKPYGIELRAVCNKEPQPFGKMPMRDMESQLGRSKNR